MTPAMASVEPVWSAGQIDEPINGPSGSTTPAHRTAPSRWYVTRTRTGGCVDTDTAMIGSI